MCDGDALDPDSISNFDGTVCGTKVSDNTMSQGRREEMRSISKVSPISMLSSVAPKILTVVCRDRV